MSRSNTRVLRRGAWLTGSCKYCLFLQKQKKRVLTFSPKNGKQKRNKLQKLIKLATTEMKAFLVQLIKGKML